jgi:DNA invertase Pin-like site-specific DNA recombinase
MKAVMYAAKSTKDKHGSNPTQLQQGRERAELEGWPVLGEFSDEDATAYHGNRGDGLAQAMAACEQAAGEVALIVQHSDRLARGNGKDARHLVEYALWAIKTSAW